MVVYFRVLSLVQLQAVNPSSSKQRQSWRKGEGLYLTNPEDLLLLVFNLAWKFKGFCQLKIWIHILIMIRLSSFFEVRFSQGLLVICWAGSQPRVRWFGGGLEGEAGSLGLKWWRPESAAWFGRGDTSTDTADLWKSCGSPLRTCGSPQIHRFEGKSMWRAQVAKSFLPGRVRHSPAGPDPASPPPRGLMFLTGRSWTAALSGGRRCGAGAGKLWATRCPAALLAAVEGLRSSASGEPSLPTAMTPGWRGSYSGVLLLGGSENNLSRFACDR